MARFLRTLILALPLCVTPALAQDSPRAVEKDELSLREVTMADEAFDRTGVLLERAVEAVRKHAERAGGDTLRDAFVRQQAGFEALERGEVENALFLTLSARLAARKVLTEASGDQKPVLASAEEKAMTARYSTARPPATYLIEAQDVVPAVKIILVKGLDVLKRPGG